MIFNIIYCHLEMSHLVECNVPTFGLLLIIHVINNWTVNMHYTPQYQSIKAMSGQLKMHKR